MPLLLCLENTFTRPTFVLSNFFAQIEINKFLSQIKRKQFIVIEIQIPKIYLLLRSLKNRIIIKFSGGNKMNQDSSCFKIIMNVP